MLISAQPTGSARISRSIHILASDCLEAHWAAFLQLDIPYDLASGPTEHKSVTANKVLGPSLRNSLNRTSSVPSRQGTGINSTANQFHLESLSVVSGRHFSSFLCSVPMSQEIRLSEVAAQRNPGKRWGSYFRSWRTFVSNGVRGSQWSKNADECVAFHAIVR